MFGGFKKELSDKKKRITGIIIDIEVPRPIWLELIKESHCLRPAVPIILSAKNESKFSDVNKNDLGVAACISSSVRYDALTASIKKIKDNHDQKNEDQEVQNIKNIDDQFIAISISAFKLGLPSPFDIYIKLQEDKYIKIINEDEAFDDNKLQQHEGKGINSYYISKEDHQIFINMFKEKINLLSQQSSGNFEEERTKYIDYGTEVLSLIQEWGIDEEKIEIAQKYVQKSGQFISEVSKKNISIQNFLSDIEALEHAVSVCLIGGLFLNKLGASKEIYDDIAMACMLHDIGMIGAPASVKSEDESKMNEDEKIIYYQHPEKGAEILRQLKFKNAIVEAVSHHHLKPHNRGFPKSEIGRVFKVNPISEVIRLSETLIFLSRKLKEEESKEDVILYFKNNEIEDYSKIVQEAFSSIFGK